MAKAYFAAGCFWGIQQRFSRLGGVEKTAVGYMGGVTNSPDYESVCTGKTGHAEVVEIEYDPKAVDFESLLSYFFSGMTPHRSIDKDPTSAPSIGLQSSRKQTSSG